MVVCITAVCPLTTSANNLLVKHTSFVMNVINNFGYMQPNTIGYVILSAILGLPYRRPILKSNFCNSFDDRGTRRFYLRMPDLQMSCGDLTNQEGSRIRAPGMAVGFHDTLRSLTHLPPGQKCRHFGRRDFQLHFLASK